MFEHKTEPLVKSHILLFRILTGLLIGVCIISFSLFIGMLGYHLIGGLSWIDSFLEAAMISAGMGPIAPLKTDSAKLFAGFYALYSGLALIVTIGVVFAPIVHRFFHAMHVELDDDKD